MEEEGKKKQGKLLLDTPIGKVWVVDTASHTVGVGTCIKVYLPAHTSAFPGIPWSWGDSVGLQLMG